MDRVRLGETKSCGCLNLELISNRNKSHGLSGTPEHRAWKAIKGRCYNKNNQDYRLYGERGIRVSDEWLNSFETFLADMGPRPSDKHSIERNDSDGDYCAGNCRWALAIEQANNTSRNKLVEFRGETRTLAQWCTALQLNYRTTITRLESGWSVEKAFTQKPDKKQIGKLFEYGGLSLTLTQWSKHIGVGVTTLAYRLKKGMPYPIVFRELDGGT